tara:strand:+ start:4171 stop:4389 length:219 start_codon:yes stop_codon:yes gene_type:complete
MLNPKNPEHIKSLEKCRNIKQEIVNFGINEDELVKLIELLSLELENSNLMREINNLIKDNPDEKKQEINLLT